MSDPSKVSLSDSACYELIDHTADIGIRVWGAKPEDLFANAGRAMFDLVFDQRSGEPDRIEWVKVAGNDRVDLLVNWLRELLFIWTGKEQVVYAVGVDSLTKTEIIGRIKTEAYEPIRHVIRHELKAVTYHQAKVTRDDNGWMAEVIFDV